MRITSWNDFPRMPHRAINGTKAGDLLLPPTPPPHRGSLRSRLRRDFDVFDILWCIVLVGMNCEMTKEVWLFAASASPPSRCARMTTSPSGGC